MTTPIKVILALGCAVLLSGCYTTTKTVFERGPMPIVTIDAPADTIRSALIADMVGAGYAIDAESENMVRFYKTAEAQGAMGVAYLSSTFTGVGKRKDAVRTVTYTLVLSDSGINVTVSSVLSGDGMQQEMTGEPAVFNEYIAQLNTIKAKLEPSPAAVPKT